MEIGKSNLITIVIYDKQIRYTGAKNQFKASRYMSVLVKHATWRVINRSSSQNSHPYDTKESQKMWKDRIMDASPPMMLSAHKYRKALRKAEKLN